MMRQCRDLIWTTGRVQSAHTEMGRTDSRVSKSVALNTLNLRCLLGFHVEMASGLLEFQGNSRIRYLNSVV